MDRYYGGKVHEDDDFHNFDAPMEDCPLPRWQRKAMDSARTENAMSTPRGSGKTPQSDRFIPNRNAMDINVSRMTLNFGDKENSTEKGSEEAHPDYSMALANSLLSQDSASATKILAFKNKAPAPKAGYLNAQRVLYSQNSQIGPRKRSTRNIPQVPERILDAPDLLDDFYLNLLDWNSENILAIALGQTVYLWNATSGSIDELCQMTEDDEYISSVSWIQEGNVLAVGTNSAQIQLYDANRMSRIRTMGGHASRVGSLAWNGPLLSSGSRDASIINHDVRVQNHHVASLLSHQQEVCGLKWSPDGTMLASGGNDNQLNIWEAGEGSNGGQRPKFTLTEHTAAVKALAWCPWQRGLLASGGGTADRTLRFWNVNGSGSCVNSIDTKSQVCSIVWNPNEKELVTSHGFSQNQLTLWKYPSLARVVELPGHTSRVLHMALSPDGQTVASAAADETLRFWNVFPASTKTLKNPSALSSSRSVLRGVNIR
eukprot:CAMPEP_0113968802 /NCGR_PEP_ID=MMETSP0011_2-20120614/9784_1 /TAXON_ID=101924 /ORGANISM="Rhodosorus marinus" /LENGTH=485 /DNA_ID=CAMNT_0000982029 /DNA_START=343 /DNA_END=1800 /DNA_ORIENTATION=+ /assembly_acc=CAM_ASM_000156